MSLSLAGHGSSPQWPSQGKAASPQENTEAGFGLTCAPMLSLLLGLLLFAYGTVLPGLALAWTMLRDPDPLLLAVLGLTIGILVLPLLHFSVALLLQTHIHAPGIVITSTAILSGCFARHRMLEARHD